MYENDEKDEKNGVGISMECPKGLIVALIIILMVVSLICIIKIK